MENIPSPNSVDNSVIQNNPQIQATSVAPSSNNISFADRFFKISSRHNRINRKGYLLNIVCMVLVAYFILSFLPSSGVFYYIGLTLQIILVYCILIQVLKRSHDFGNRGFFFAFMILILVGSYMLLPFLLQNVLNDGDGIMYMLLLRMSLGLRMLQIVGLILLLVGLLPGYGGDNKFGSPQSV